MKRETGGYIAGFFATLTLSEFNLLFGILCAVVMALCSLPGGILKWRNLIYDYRKAQSRAKDYAPFGVLRYCLGGMQKPAVESVSSQTDIHFPDNRQ